MRPRHAPDRPRAAAAFDRDAARAFFDDGAVIPAPVDCRRLILFRHPELDAAHQSRAVGDGDAALGHRGRAQVLELLARLEDHVIDEVHAGPQEQCRLTAQVVAEARKLQPKVDARLRDQNMGSWQGRLWDEVLQQDGERLRAFFREFGDTAAPGGESLGSAVERVLAWWTDTAPGVVGKSLCVVLPGSMLSGFAAAMLGMRLSRCVSLNLPHGGVGVLDAYDNGVRIVSWNPGALS